MESQLTYQWLVPILLTIIGFFIVYYLNSMNSKIKDIDDKFTKHVDKVDSWMNTASEKHFKTELRVTRLEDHIISK
jgi:hypothetical protein